MNQGSLTYLDNGSFYLQIGIFLRSSLGVCPMRVANINESCAAHSGGLRTFQLREKEEMSVSLCETESVF